MLYHWDNNSSLYTSTAEVRATGRSGAEKLLQRRARDIQLLPLVVRLRQVDFACGILAAGMKAAAHTSKAEAKRRKGLLRYSELLATFLACV